MAGVEDDEVRGPGGRRRGRLAVAAVAGAVLVAGGGAYWAASAGHRPAGPVADRGAAGPPPLALSGWTAPAGAAGGGGAVRVTGTLPPGPASAPVYRAAGPSAGRVARLAAALRITGHPVAGAGVWKAGPAGGGAGPTLQVGRDAPGSWAFVRDGGGVGCAPPSGPAPGARPCYGTAGGQPAGGQPAGGQPAGGGPVSPAAAGRAAAPVLAAVGLSGARIGDSEADGAVRTVTADPVVGGLPTSGWSTSVLVGPDGSVLSASGRLSPVARGADYPVVSARQAVDELRIPSGGSSPAQRMCGGGVMHPGAAGGAAPAPSGSPVRENAPCLSATPALRVTGARFGLSEQLVDGTPTLVPSWLLSVVAPSASSPSGSGPARVLAQPAVDPRYLTAPGVPNVPVPAPTGSGAPPAAPAPTGSAAPSGPAAPPTGTPGTGVRVDSYTAAGRTVTLRFWGGVCSAYSARATAQGGGSVSVRITSAVRHPGRPCPALVRQSSVEVTLSAPLGDRSVTDSGDGHRVPAYRP